MSGFTACPSRLRFRQSRLYISVIPPLVIGFLVGAMSAIMGIGGGFIIVPAMIYLLRMPTNVVIGTSLVQIIGVAVITTVLQATSNYAVDIVLAAILIVGGVIGAQFGVRAGAKLQRRAIAAAAGAAGAGGGGRLAVGTGGAAIRCLQPVAGIVMRRFLLLACLMAAAPVAGRGIWCPASART